MVYESTLYCLCNFSVTVKLYDIKDFFLMIISVKAICKVVV